MQGSEVCHYTRDEIESRMNLSFNIKLLVVLVIAISGEKVSH